MRHQHQGRTGRARGDERAHRGRLAVGAGAVGEKGIERRLGHDQFAEGAARGLQAAAPAAGEHAPDHDGAAPEALPQAARLVAAGIRQVALGGAIIDAEAGRVAGAGRGGVADEGDALAGGERLPGGVRRGEGDRARQQGGGPEEDAGHGVGTGPPAAGVKRPVMVARSGCPPYVPAK
ncbi:hypothetical protein STVA_46540 [Allostella vacuolata]|nr:hypothetical protein STVA_46540 [Stella vacuolata]